MNAEELIAYRKIKNGEKVRIVHRLKKMIEELNQRSDDHFMLVAASENVEKHFSCYGSRRLVQAAINSDLKEKVPKERSQDKITVYVPVANVKAEEDEEKKSENYLWGKVGSKVFGRHFLVYLQQILSSTAPSCPLFPFRFLSFQVVHLLDLYNYPCKEHFSFKGHQPRCRPKPLFWPRDIKYTSLVNTTINNIFEKGSSYSYGTKKDAIRRVLKASRVHYSTFLRNLKGENIFLRYNPTVSSTKQPRKDDHSDEPTTSFQKPAHESAAASSSQQRVWYERPSADSWEDEMPAKKPHLQQNDEYFKQSEGPEYCVDEARYSLEETFEPGEYLYEEVIGDEDTPEKDTDGSWIEYEPTPSSPENDRNDVEEEEREEEDPLKKATTPPRSPPVDKQEPGADQQPQLVKTVLVQGASGPILRKYIFKLRKK